MNITFKANKLVRDKIPALLEEKEIRHATRVMDDIEYIKQLKLKLLEEAQECNQACTQQELIEELCDVMEVICSLLQAEQITMKQIEEAQDAKKQKKGGFDRKLYCSTFEMDENNPAIGYYLKRFDQYPQQ